MMTHGDVMIDGDKKCIDPQRLARALTLGVWAGFFSFLWFSGDVTRYLGPRTQWVVVFGAITLALAAGVHVLFLRTAHPGRLTLGQMLGYLLIVFPVAIAVMVPEADLGALAASRKLTGTELAQGTAVVREPDTDRPLSFVDLSLGSRSPEYATAAGIDEGEEIELVGFVTHDNAVEGFNLTRFYISCCAADAVPYSTEIVAPAGTDYPDDTWLKVEGRIAKGPRGFLIEADDIEEVEEPDPPYLY